MKKPPNKTVPHVEYIHFTPASPPALEVGSSQQFVATAHYSDRQEVRVTDAGEWSSSDVDVLTVTSGGLVSALGPGSAVISFELDGVVGTISLSATAEGEVVLVSIAVTPSSPTLEPTETQQMTATGTYSDASTVDLTAVVDWDSADESKATIDGDGLLTAVADGSSLITATFGAVSGNTTAEIQTGAPEVDSYAPSSGEIGETIDIVGSAFTSTTLVEFNGTSAAFVVVDDQHISAVVPNDATTGTVSVTTPSGTGVGPSFVVEPNNFAFDLTTPSFPSGLVASRTGATMYPDRSASTAASSSTPEVFEDHGDAQGGGFWTFPSYRNGLAAALNDFGVGVGWVYTGAPTYTANDAIAPDGTLTADKLDDAAAGVSKSIAFADLSETSAEPLIATVWVKDVSGSAPTAPGALSCIAKLFCASLDDGTTWRRVVSIWYNFAIAQGRHMVIMPAGAAVQADGTVVEDPAATGAVHLWGGLTTKGLALLPTTAGTSGDLTIDAVDPENALDLAGDFHVEGAFLMDTLFNNGGPPSGVEPYVVFAMDTPNGQFRLEYYDQILEGFFNGANIINGVTFSLNVGYLDQDGEVRWEFWNRPGENDSGMQFFMSGERITSLRSISVPQATPSTFHLGHAGGANIMPRRHTLLRKITRAVDAAHVVVLGDSIISAYSPYSSVGSRILTLAESRTKQIVSYAYPGETVLQQKTKWEGSAQRGAAGVAAVLVHAGTNDFLAGASTATVTSRYQSLIADINAQNPGALVFLSPLLPCKANPSIGAVIWARMEAFNANLLGSGGTPITGSNLVRIPYWVAADDGAGNLITAYANTDAGAPGDDLHQNTACRRDYMAPIIRSLFVSNGVL